MKITRNVGIIDRIIRLVMGTALIVVGLTVAKGTLGVIFLILSAPLILSALLGFCPSYTLLGLSTKQRDDCC
ncbi:MAG: DUF2892 domain-containing protein [Syntrophus sp. (in: bacteria)]